MSVCFASDGSAYCSALYPLRTCIANHHPGHADANPTLPQEPSLLNITPTKITVILRFRHSTAPFVFVSAFDQIIPLLCSSFIHLAHFFYVSV